MSDQPVLSLEAVTLRYGDRVILENGYGVFPRNSVCALTGASGSGKSTLLRTFCRMNDALPGFVVEGTVSVLGQDIYNGPVDEYTLRRRVGLIFQKPCMFPKSIYHNVVFGLRHHLSEKKSEFPERAEQALKKAFLWNEVKDRLDDPAPTLSQGQQQRLAIARTLAVDPEILLMDEPTSALDPKSARAIEELILSLKSRHTIVWVTHQVEQARRTADCILRMENRTLRVDNGQPI
ncbi:Phosphate ABC transporter, ATP-binding protein [Nitrospina gracilis 3/211]|uniref:Phosphate ABC transporter, ATP-binding protein n=1 Tax=Nitrospina gracilis (strain 3/211) TaxID=1266370 RepID=M1YHL1_NITG3|nr:MULTISPECIES: ATP-binding cassette domain-containing protein [Nitrospina]MCF8722362.1 phosphate transport system ATP-binding protein [Nitrospina sp. Nb-3]CCQ89975.1 Phosphate ABC transporter, ATP-binding protein [Nitrospina gracilis 3/211]